MLARNSLGGLVTFIQSVMPFLICGSSRDRRPGASSEKQM
jgi:hypothetical protein